MKKIFLISLSIGTLLSFTACNKFLNIYPDDKLIQEQILGSEPAINNVLNGIYMNMANNSTYGGGLSMTIIECLAQQYDLSVMEHNFQNHGQYKYGENNVKGSFAAIWEQMYVQILSINDFMNIVDKATVAIPDSRKNILLGEAYALRAFHHFDLLRLFGPVYASDSTSVTMPYSTGGNGQLDSLLPANRVMEKILADLATAETLLQQDNIITQGIVKQKGVDPVANFYTNRHYRMNYYAVKALQARVQLWRGNKQAALAAAKAVLNAPLVQSGQLFKWLTLPLDGANPDRVFSSEIIFGIRNRNMYSLHNTYFAGGAQDRNILHPAPARLEAAYDNDENDPRYGRLWFVPADKTYKTFFKYASPSDLSATDTTFAYFQPLIRKAELYYIVAECEPDPATGAAALREVRSHRGFSDPSVPEANLTAAIQKEYQKEFYGEGQLFYYYKRQFITGIPNGNAATGNITMNAGTYRIPLPDEEQESRLD